MNLTAQEARLVLAGQKTQHWIPCREPRDVIRRNGTEYRTQPFRPAAGRTLVVRAPQMIDGRPVLTERCTVIIIDFAHHLAAALDFPAARALGHRTTVEAKAVWVRRYDGPWVARQDEPDDETLADRFDRRHADQPVWAMTFHLDREQAPRLLATTGRGDDRGYTANTDQAVAGEPEAVDDRWLAAIAKGIDNGDHQAALAELAKVNHSLLRARAHARACGVNIDADVRTIERRRDAIVTKLEQRPRAA